MYLDGEIVACIDKLDEQGESITELLIYLFTDQLLFVACEQLAQRHTREWSVGNDRYIVVYSRYFPALTDTVLPGFYLFEFADIRAAPNNWLEDGSELEGVECLAVIS